MNKARWIISLTAAAAALGVSVACGGGATPDPTSHPTTAAVTTAPTRKPTLAPTAKPTSAPPSSQPPISAVRRNAMNDAQTYLGMTGFSRKGLIRQLSSDSGDGYTVADATAAVDRLHPDWNAQAVRSANAYLSTQPFSRKGLIRQLEAGDFFTPAQAVYGVDHSDLSK